MTVFLAVTFLVLTFVLSPVILRVVVTFGLLRLVLFILIVLTTDFRPVFLIVTFLVGMIGVIFGVVSALKYCEASTVLASSLPTFFDFGATAFLATFTAALRGAFFVSFLLWEFGQHF